MRNLFIIGLFVLFASLLGCTTREEPINYKNSVSFITNDDKLIITIKTHSDPGEYSLYELNLFANNSDQTFNTTNTRQFFNNDTISIELNKSLIRLKNFEIKVMLLNKKGKLELYS